MATPLTDGCSLQQQSSGPAFSIRLTVSVSVLQDVIKIKRLTSGADPGGGCTGGTFPGKPQVIFYKHNTTSCTVLQVYGHYVHVLLKRLALLGPAAIVDHFAGSGARRLCSVF